MYDNKFNIGDAVTVHSMPELYKRGFVGYGIIVGVVFADPHFDYGGVLSLTEEYSVTSRYWYLVRFIFSSEASCKCVEIFSESNLKLRVKNEKRVL